MRLSLLVLAALALVAVSTSVCVSGADSTDAVLQPAVPNSSGGYTRVTNSGPSAQGKAAQSGSVKKLIAVVNGNNKKKYFDANANSKKNNAQKPTNPSKPAATAPAKNAAPLLLPYTPAKPAMSPYSAVILAVGKGDRAAVLAGPPGRYLKPMPFRPSTQGGEGVGAVGAQCGALVNGWIMPGVCQENPGKNVWPTRCQVFFANPSDFATRYWKCVFPTDDGLTKSGWRRQDEYNKQPVPLDLPTQPPRSAAGAGGSSACGRCNPGECCRATQQSTHYQCMQC